jgi:hypothetical protein
MKRWIPMILMASWLVVGGIQGQVVYRWVDESGTIHFTDDPTSIPEKYRKQTEERKPPESPETRPEAVHSPPDQRGPAPSRTDQLGRGELWWRAKVKEWEDKLETAQRHYEETRAALEATNREIGASKLKPDSFQRKLKAEKKALEEKVDHWERQIKEAKEMLEKTLPREAQDYGADPAWLKPPD